VRTIRSGSARLLETTSPNWNWEVSLGLEPGATDEWTAKKLERLVAASPGDRTGKLAGAGLLSLETNETRVEKAREKAGKKGDKGLKTASDCPIGDLERKGRTLREGETHWSRTAEPCSSKNGHTSEG